MAVFRIETDVDAASGLIYAEGYYPKDAVEPFASTAPIYRTHEQAAAEILEMFKKAFPDQPVEMK